MLVAHQRFTSLLTVKPRNGDEESDASGSHGFAFEASASSSIENQRCTKRGALKTVKLGVSTDIIP